MASFDDTLTALIGDRSCAGIRIRTDYTSATGSTITPPAGTLRDANGDVAGEFDLPDGSQAVTIDSWGSQASRMEHALHDAAEATGYPLVRFRAPTGDLLTTSLDLSHRHADAVWRATRTELDAAGIPFQDVQNATLTDAAALTRWFPTAVALGWWHSHTDKNDKDAELAKLGGDVAAAMKGYARAGTAARSTRLLTSEVIATGIHRRVRMPAKHDSLFGAVARLKDPDGKATKVKPSHLGIGSLPPMRVNEGPFDVTFTAITGTAYLSLTGLRRFHFCGDAEEQLLHQRLVAALALLMHTLMQQDLLLRAGTELLITAPPVVDICRHGAPDESVTLPGVDDLTVLVRDLGAQVGWSGPVDVTIPDDAVLSTLLKLVDRKGDDDD